MDPVYAFYNVHDCEHTFHTGDPWPNEERRDIQYYVFREEAPGTVPVYDWW
eukprot:CAMPEP_0179255602 /NCGR_PEP_ID=MMETSP0797-20121207/23834_1 /TAXON_ID=47934 /ORGANISM="Dinophysis acuminata, Strain DAEP01" /LENGTH=50 /DNA_ID=CAMNT_0020963507 /DNA_START=82 /DNA_END=231 /DNA_ORIENTATION=-